VKPAHKGTGAQGTRKKGKSVPTNQNKAKREDGSNVKAEYSAEASPSTLAQSEHQIASKGRKRKKEATSPYSRQVGGAAVIPEQSRLKKKVKAKDQGENVRSSCGAHPLRPKTKLSNTCPGTRSNP